MARTVPGALAGKGHSYQDSYIHEFVEPRPACVNPAIRLYIAVYCLPKYSYLTLDMMTMTHQVCSSFLLQAERLSDLIHTFSESQALTRGTHLRGKPLGEPFQSGLEWWGKRI
jgi:hypothetical protein